jgi:hypothetical protein
VVGCDDYLARVTVGHYFSKSVGAFAPSSNGPTHIHYIKRPEAFSGGCACAPKSGPGY